jgi:hypothetical protein
MKSAPHVIDFSKTSLTIDSKGEYLVPVAIFWRACLFVD